MSKMFYHISVDSEEQYEQIQAFLRKNRQALDTLFKSELGHECKISDGEIIADALQSQLSVTRSSIRIMLTQKQMER